MTTRFITLDYKKPAFLFCIGFCIVLLSGWLPIASNIITFIHMWKVELSASILFLITLTYSFYQYHRRSFSLCISRQEIHFIVLPLLLFIVWSLLSVLWADSWKSALHHTLVWAEYLLFYLIVRHILEYQNGYKYFLSLITITFIIIGMPAILEYFSIMYMGGPGQVMGIGIRYAKYGEQIYTFFPLLLVGILRLNSRQFTLGLLSLVVMWLFIISTAGRTNILLFVSGILVISCFVFAIKRFHKYRRKTALIILALILVPIPLHSITLLSEKPNIPIVNRISNEAGITYSGNFRKLMATISTEMFITHPIIGVGADNYGMQFNKYRELYVTKNPTDVNLTTSESEIAERSHNEFLQILAELGIIGGIIFLWFLTSVGLMIINSLKFFRKISLFSLAALSGVIYFLASSLVTSFSFRFVQNGFVFFLVLAVAAKSLLAPKFVKQKNKSVILTANYLKLAYGFSMTACLMLMVYCGVRATSAYYTIQGNKAASIEQAIPSYQFALQLDDENPNANFGYGMRLMQNGRYAEAIPQFEQTISKQCATSPVYSYLSTALTLAGDSEGSQKSFARALNLYPLSVFVRTRYSSLLKANGETEESDKQLGIAFKLDRKQTNTWRSLFDDGYFIATQKGANNDDFVQTDDLLPLGAIDPILVERNIKFPSEGDHFKFDN